MILRIKTTLKIRPLSMAQMVVLFLRFHCISAEVKCRFRL